MMTGPYKSSRQLLKMLHPDYLIRECFFQCYYEPLLLPAKPDINQGNWLKQTFIIFLKVSEPITFLILGSLLSCSTKTFAENAILSSPLPLEYPVQEVCYFNNNPPTAFHSTSLVSYTRFTGATQFLNADISLYLSDTKMK